ncbi:redox-regulated ATPase YchF, partial [Streptococcus pyogenes]
EASTVLPMMEEALKLLQDGKPARVLLKGIAPEDLAILKGLNLLTSHPVLYVCNVAEGDAATGNEHTRAVEKMAEAQGAGTVVISAAIEAEVAQLPDAEELEFLASMGLEEPGLDKLIRAGYDLLHLITYFTAGPKETR